MKFFFDYFPIILFFIIYKAYDIYIATAVAIAASLLQLLVYWLKHRQFEKMHLITAASIVILGGITLIFHNDIFIKWKPTVVYWIFALVLLGSQYLYKKPIIKNLLGNQINMPEKNWNRLNLSWALFFIGLGLLNIYIFMSYDTDTWVYFKLFGTLIITLVFVVAQSCYLYKYMQDEKNKEP